MTKLLLWLFIKDADKTEDMSVRSSYGKLAGITGTVCNVLLFLAKLTAALVSGSISILADAINNLSDAGSSIITFFGFRMAGKEADAEHPYGHARMEYLSALAIAALILLVGVELFKSSFGCILRPASIRLTPMTVGIVNIEGMEYKKRCKIYQMKTWSSHIMPIENIKYMSQINTPLIVLNHSDENFKYEFRDVVEEELRKRNNSAKIVCASDKNNIFFI